MAEIPVNVTDIKPDERVARIDKVCDEIAADIQSRRNRGLTHICATVNTEHCYGGGHPMYAILEAAKRYAAKGWYCYLVRGGAYRNWTWLKVFDREHTEGYTEANLPSYYERVR